MAEQMEFVWGGGKAQAPDERSHDEPIVAAAGGSPQEDRQRLAEALRQALLQGTGMSIQLRITNNSSTILSMKHVTAHQSARVSLHHMFLTAPDSVRKALAHWIRHPKSKSSGHVIDQFIRDHRHLIQGKMRRTGALVTKGRVYDLAEMYQEINRRYFDDAVNAKITWGKWPMRNHRRSIRFGSHETRSNVIRIHPLLDQVFVPPYFVAYIVYHEMLHAYLGVKELPSGRRSMHGREFKAREEAYPEFERAKAWMNSRKNMDTLLGRLSVLQKIARR